VGAGVVPLAGAPFVLDGRLFVPLQLVTEVVPRFAPDAVYDAARGELRVGTGMAAAAQAPPVAGQDRASAQAGGATRAGAAPAARELPGAVRGAAPSRSPERSEGSARGAPPAAESTPRRTAARNRSDAPDTIRASDSYVPAREPSSRPAPGRRRRRVVVDAGHGGPDRGMTGPIGDGPRVVEKDITLAVAKRLAAALRERGYDVLMTRTTDTLIALADRGRIANQNHGDLFVSVHVNAANPTWKNPAAARGFETYFLAEAKTEDAKRVEQMENESVRFETGAYAPKGDPLSFVIADMAQNEHLRESSDLAALVQREMGKIHPGPDRGVRQANFAVLRGSYMPAVLVEIGFGTNSKEAAFLTSEARQERVAQAIADATAAYLRRYERRISRTVP
jgi:N-acetylmuramoyl-L-alanine amidase